MSQIDDLRTDIEQAQQKLRQHIQLHWRLFLLEGVLFVCFGLAAILVPHFFPW